MIIIIKKEREDGDGEGERSSFYLFCVSIQT